MIRTSPLFLAISLAILASVVALLALAMEPAQGAVGLPSGFTKSKVIKSGLTKPMDMEFAPDGRLFVAEQGGTVRIAKPDGTLVKSIDISAKIDSSGERGLQALTFDPNFPTNHYVYLDYTKKATATVPVHNRIVRFTLNGNKSVAGSEKLIFRLSKQNSAYHMGGAIDFGKDGKLYISTGDNETSENAQKLTNLFGKMLRINKNGTIPSNNPFYATASGRNRAIWALGLRNPFKFAVKPGSPNLFINDPGENTWEEINRGESGANYGWPTYEGFVDSPDPALQNYQNPAFAYGHDGDPATTGCAITGGTFYNPATVQFPNRFLGGYLFTDVCSGWIRRYDPATDTAKGFATGLGRIVDLEVSKDGKLYYLTRPDPAFVGMIRYTGN
jgi:glucose/arabinose dehydrogenase